MSTEPKPEAAPEVDPRTGLTQAQIDAELARRDAVAQANADPLPGPLAAAYEPEPVIVGPFTVRPWVPFDLVVLRKIDSPLIRQIAELAKPEAERKPTEYSDDDEFVMIFQFITPIERVRELIKRGRAAFEQAAIEEVATNPMIGAVLQIQLVDAVTRQFLRAFSTAIKYGGEGEGTFTKPPPEKMTGSAGGSNSRPAS